MLRLFIDWIIARYKKYKEDEEVRRAADLLKLLDCGWSKEAGEGEMIFHRLHLVCGTRAREGITREDPVRVYWCYRCKRTWHPFDGGEGDSKGNPPPFDDPTHFLPQSEWRESEEVISRFTKKWSHR